MPSLARLARRTFVCNAILAASCATADRAGEPWHREPRALDDQLERLQSELEGQAPVETEPAAENAWQEIAARAPIHASRPSFFHAALEVPAMESAVARPAGTVTLRMKTDHTRSNSERDVVGSPQDFDGLFHEFLTVEGMWSLAEHFEVGGRTTLAGWDEHIDRFQVFDETGLSLVRDENVVAGSGPSERHTDLSTFGLRAKWQILEAQSAGWDFALAPSFKFPFGRARNLTHAGTYDGALTLLASFPLDEWTIHASLGGTVPWGSQNLFVSAADIELNPFLHGGFSVVAPLGNGFSGIVQLEAQTSAFHDVAALDQGAATVLFGLRTTSASTSFELAVGTGLDWDAAYQFLFHFECSFRL